MTDPVRGLRQINLTGYVIPFDREPEKGLGRINLYDEDDNLVASLPADDESVEVTEYKG